MITEDHALRATTLGDQLRRNAQRHGDRAAVVAYRDGRRRELSYGAFNHAVNQAAAGLVELGVGRGSVIAVMGRNSPEQLITFWAAMKLGAAMTGVNYTFKPTEMRYQLEHSGATTVVVDHEFVPLFEQLDPPPPAVDRKIVVDAGVDVAGDDWFRFSRLLAHDEPPEPEIDFSAETIAFLVYTSGTEGRPKAVALSHRSYLTSTMLSWSLGLRLHDDEVWLYLMPFHTLAGMGTQTALLGIGNTLVLPAEVDAEASVQMIHDERVTCVSQTPTFYVMLARTAGFDESDLSTLRTCLSYGGTIPRAMFERYATAAPHMRWVTAWSQSEVAQALILGTFRSFADIPAADPSWIGRPTGQLEIRIVDANGEHADEGELQCRTPGVMLGYHDDPERTAEKFAGGWLHTGDLVRRDAAGELFFVDRQSDVIKTGGMNVSSVEVERILYRHPAVIEVAVVGVADDYWSQAVHGFVVSAHDNETSGAELIAFCKDALAPFKVPKVIHFVSELPRDTQGKILKRELRKHVPQPAALATEMTPRGSA